MPLKLKDNERPLDSLRRENAESQNVDIEFGVLTQVVLGGYSNSHIPSPTRKKRKGHFHMVAFCILALRGNLKDHLTLEW